MKTTQTSKDSPQNSATRNENRVSFFQPFIQPKLTVNAPGDAYEQEADAVADKVMRMKDNDTSHDFFFKPAISSVQRKCQHCKEEEKETMTQRKKDTSVIQRQSPDEYDEPESTSQPAPKPDAVPSPVLPNVPNFQLTPPEPIDYLGINRSFLNRGVSPFGYGNAAQQEWSRQYQLYSTLGAGNVLNKTFLGGALRFFGVTPPGGDWNAWLSNQTTPKAIDSALQRDYPNLNEQEERRGGLPAPTTFNLPSINFKKEDGSDDPAQAREESEADAVADAIMQDNSTSSSFVQAKCAQCEEDETTQRKENGNEEGTVSSSTETYISTLSGGQPLGSEERSFFEDRIGHDFSDVRIHNDSTAQSSAKSMNALAYTHGNNIVFAAGQYQPDTDNGKKLMAHELTHVVQQSATDNTVQRDEQKPPPDRYEDLKDDKKAKEVFEKLNPPTLGRYCTQNCPAVAEALEEYLKTGVFPETHCDPLGEGNYGYDISDTEFSDKVTGWDKFWQKASSNLKKHGDFLVIEAERTEEQAKKNSLTQWHYFLVLNIKGKNFIVDAFTREVNADLSEYTTRLVANSYRYAKGDFKIKKVRVSK